MRYWAEILMTACSLFGAAAWAAYPQTPSTQSQVAAPSTTQVIGTQDPQAVSIASQVLSAAGGVARIKTIADYTATGTVTIPLGQGAQGTVTIRGSGLDLLRVDSSFSSNQTSQSFGNGQVSEKAEDGIVRQAPYRGALLASRFLVPYLPLAALLNSSGYSFVNKGSVQLDGNTVENIQVQRVFSGISNLSEWQLKALTIDYFVDPNTLRVVMVQDIKLGRMVRRIRYTDYKIVNGLSIPFSISEEDAGQIQLHIQLNTIQFNTGLLDSDFQL